MFISPTSQPGLPWPVTFSSRGWAFHSFPAAPSSWMCWLCGWPLLGIRPGRAGLGERPCSDTLGIFFTLCQDSGAGEQLPVPLCGFFWTQVPQCTPWFSFSQSAMPCPVHGSCAYCWRSSLIWGTLLSQDLKWLQGNIFSSRVNSWTMGDTQTCYKPWWTGSTFTCNSHFQNTTKGSHWPFPCLLDFLR